MTEKRRVDRGEVEDAGVEGDLKKKSLPLEGGVMAERGDWVDLRVLVSLPLRSRRLPIMPIGFEGAKVDTEDDDSETFGHSPTKTCDLVTSVKASSCSIPDVG
jgi:hypothetical protein